MKLEVLRKAINGHPQFTSEDIMPFLVENGYFDPEQEARALEHYREIELQKGMRQLRKGGHREIVSTETETPSGEVVRRWYQLQLCGRPQLEYLRAYAANKADYWMKETNFITTVINQKFGMQMPLPFPEAEDQETA